MILSTLIVLSKNNHIDMDGPRRAYARYTVDGKLIPGNLSQPNSLFLSGTKRRLIER